MSSQQSNTVAWTWQSSCIMHTQMASENFGWLACQNFTKSNRTSFHKISNMNHCCEFSCSLACYMNEHRKKWTVIKNEHGSRILHALILSCIFFSGDIYGCVYRTPPGQESSRQPLTLLTLSLSPYIWRRYLRLWCQCQVEERGDPSDFRQSPA